MLQQQQQQQQQQQRQQQERNELLLQRDELQLQLERNELLLKQNKLAQVLAGVGAPLLGGAVGGTGVYSQPSPQTSEVRVGPRLRLGLGVGA